ncbi:restriction endonuclease subunit S domain-containing protein, partial [Lacticaseibacillus paracasei]|uniref:restriction endonuclease subunit S n=1 Tax=Lacticaseibacillus paracasei TaxID=1597 RepID=UPI0038703563
MKSSSKKYKKTQKNDLIYSSNNLETGSIGLNKTGNAVISPVYSVFQVTDEAIPSFMGNMILRRRFIDKMLRYRQGIMYGQWRIHELDFLQIVVNVPQTAEQFQIGQLFSALDALIAATQDKIDALEQAKRALLQRLFDQSWRFKGYSGSWEKHKLGDLAKRVRGNDGRMDLPILTISAGNGWLTQKERFSQSIAGNELKNYTLLAKNELSYNHGNSKLAKYGAVFALKKYNEALVPRVYHSFDVSGKADSNFIEYLFSSKTPDHELRKLISSGARMDGLLNINYASFMNIS